MSEVKIQYILDNTEIRDILSDEDVYTILDLCNRNVDLGNYKFRSCPLRIMSDDLNYFHSRDDIIALVSKIANILSNMPNKITKPDAIDASKNTAYTNIDRDDFIHVFSSVFYKTLIDEPYFIEDLCESNVFVGDFHLFYNEAEYYILHLKSGILINWYKHLGRANFINAKGFTLDDFRSLLIMLECDIMDNAADAIIS